MFHRENEKKYLLYSFIFLLLPTGCSCIYCLYASKKNGEKQDLFFPFFLRICWIKDLLDVAHKFFLWKIQ
ncbi:MAG: hypothetical protein A2Z19_04815 [Deltaproteobacteria bacterium RBG_16_54_18]|nr:MAG: hypothetical protein A2Z19_04815 [Deltaproteobacteria bacterium RBG_16_54_18]